jgi:hypothetical protein
MRIQFLLLGIFASLKVLALDQAVPWEMMYFYAAYKAEWLAFQGGSQRQIATNCRPGSAYPGSNFITESEKLGLKGMCSFDDFVKHVGTQRTFLEYPRTLEGNTWAFDTLWTALQAKFIGKKTANSFKYDFQKLLPKAGLPTGKTAYPQVIKTLGNCLQIARDASPALVDPVAAVAGEFIRITHQLRIGNTVGFEVDAVNAFLALSDSFPFTKKFKASTTIRPPGQNTGSLSAYNNELDIDATMTLGPDGQPNGSTKPQRNAFTRYHADEYTQKDKVKIHADVIQAYASVKDLLSQNIGGCRLVPKVVPKKRDLLFLESEHIDWTEYMRPISKFGYQSHLVKAEMKFIKNPEMIIPHLSFGSLMGMIEISI